MEASLRRFGDEYSTLVDQHERRSFEMQLTQAILGRSLSEQRGRVSKPRGQESSFRKVMKKILGPILGKKSSPPSKNGPPNPKDQFFWKTCSRSLRV
ncbi:hypothetical protein F511_03377 [Dorcoceras hygrometricum]|uniref:Uncharacterized protein n=1 Tax=Dorcoceras hygrometricum TaxID=472368 RepID=A0A2Z7BMD7_9LAMI|nr:hypothetical protein F511_03377 [Dorcoceras hygrometricum]